MRSKQQWNQERLQLQADIEISYFLRCSDCEGVSENYFNTQQAGHLGDRDGWRDIGQRIVCPKCAPKYMTEPQP